MVNVASTRVALCTDYVNLGDPPGGAIGLAYDEPGADGSFTEVMDEGYQRQPAHWGPPDSDGVCQADPVTFDLPGGTYQYVLYLHDIETDTLIDYCQLTGAVLPDDGATLVVTPRYTQS
jgi:hypothetical protein